MFTNTVFSFLDADPTIGNTVNSHGAPAFKNNAENVLAQIVCTGTFGNGFYVTGDELKNIVTSKLKEVDPTFIAKLAIYGRTNAYMKDMPVYMTAYLAVNHIELFKAVFPIVVDNGRMLRKFVEIIRSGELGRKSFGTAVKNEIKKWIYAASTRKMLEASIGNKPSLKDIISLSHPKPKDEKTSDFWQWISGRSHKEENLPEEVQELLKFRRGEISELPNVPFMYLLSERLNRKNWVDLAKQATWTQLRMNLNNFMKNGAFDNEADLRYVCERLADPDQVKKSKVFPYQIFAAHKNLNKEAGYVSQEIQTALGKAVEISIENIPFMDKEFLIMTDVSSSMGWSVTNKSGAPSSMKYVDIAALFTALVIKRCKAFTTVLFNEQPIAAFNAVENNATVFELAETMTSYCQGGTDCSSTMIRANSLNTMHEVVVVVSDNESWLDLKDAGEFPMLRNHNPRHVKFYEEWLKYKERVPNAKLICIDIAPNRSFQAPDQTDILHISGFSDDVIVNISKFINGEMSDMASLVNAVEIPQLVKNN